MPDPKKAARIWVMQLELVCKELKKVQMPFETAVAVNNALEAVIHDLGWVAAAGEDEEKENPGK
jgi:hypothetical protein